MLLIPGQNLQIWKKYSENLKIISFTFMKLYVITHMT